MSRQNPCRRCGTPNDPMRLFCSRCGARLSLGEPVARGRGRWLLRLVELLLLVAMVLLLWPVHPQGVRGGQAEALSFDRKLRQLTTAIAQRAPTFQILSEAEVNGYLAEILKRNPNLARSEGLAQLGIGDLNLRFQKEGITVTLIAVWGPLRLSYEVVGRPVVEAGRFRLDVQRARWGHLPLVGPAAQWMVRRLATVCSGLERERQVIEHLKRLDVGPGQVRLITGP